MDVKRIRFVAGPAVAVGLLVSLWVTPAAAAECVLTAPVTVKVGTPLAIDGTGFPASSIVAIELTVEGGKVDRFSVQSDAAGGFQISVTPGAADTGRTTVVASAGPGCSAQVVATVLGPNDTPPRTDAGAMPGAGPAETAQNTWRLAVAALLIGMIGLIATGPIRGR